MSTRVPSVLILGHSFVKRLKRDLRSNFDPRADGKFKRWGNVSVLFHSVGGCTVPKLLSSDLHVVAQIAPDVLILEFGTNDLVVTSPEIVGSEIENLAQLGALRFSSIISTLCFLSSLRFFVGYIEFFLTRRKIFLCLWGVHVDPEVQYHLHRSCRVLFFGHNACFKNCLPHSLHLLNFHTFYPLIFQCFATSSPIRGIYFLLLIHSSQMSQNFYVTILGIHPVH